MRGEFSAIYFLKMREALSSAGSHLLPSLLSGKAGKRVQGLEAALTRGEVPLEFTMDDIHRRLYFATDDSEERGRILEKYGTPVQGVL